MASSIRTIHLKLVSVPEPVTEADVELEFEKGAIKEVEGFEAYEALMYLLARHRGYRALWVNRDFEISLSDLHAYGMDLTKLTFSTAKRTNLVLKNALDDGRYPILIAPRSELTSVELAELEFHLKTASSCLFLLS